MVKYWNCYSNIIALGTVQNDYLNDTVRLWRAEILCTANSLCCF